MSGAAAQTGLAEGSLSNPPEVDVVFLKPRELPRDSVPWQVDLRVDILLLTAKECEFLSCIRYLNPGYYKSYEVDLGYVYLGEMGNGDAKLKVAVMQCNMGSVEADGSTIVAPKAVCALHPKAVICVGYCAGFKEKNVKLGDVIISSKLATHAPTKITASEVIERGVRVPAGPLLSGILKSADHGWKAPLKNPNDLEVEVHKDPRKRGFPVSSPVLEI